MGNRLTQIATRTGDNGTTGLGNNQRVSKNSLRVHDDMLHAGQGVLEFLHHGHAVDVAAGVGHAVTGD
ncbi:MAG: hypothetical protein ACKODU_01825, partial [Limnohabitans sp.]